MLIRALEPVAGRAVVRVARGAPGVADDRLLAGPALACAGMSIDRSLDGHDLTRGSLLWVAPDQAFSNAHADGLPAIVAGPRIGVAYAGPGWADLPWRFGLAGSPSLSRPFPSQAGATLPAA